jgi:radical SAM protein with 4Fe4S-binding SPASM domain
VITGGEPLLYSQHEALFYFLRNTSRSFQLVLQTNGILINENNLEKLKVFDLIQLSFDTVEDVRKKGNKSLGKARMLFRNKIKCYLFATIHKRNLHLIKRMIQKAKRSNVPIAFNICQPTKNLEEKILLTKKELMETEKKLLTLYQQKKILHYFSPLTALFDQNKKGKFKGIKGGCVAGVAACVISPEGEVFPCPFLRISAGNIFKKSLKEIWLNSSLFHKLRQRDQFDEPCSSCEYLSFCGGCRHRAFLASGNIQGFDPMCYKNLMY